MQRFAVIALIWLLGITSLAAQSTYLKRPELMAFADSCLQHTYGCSFNTARHYQQELSQLTPEHPAPPFLEALIIYWEHFPLTPDDPESELFTELMDTCMMRARRMINNESSHLEGVFFDLFSRAFKAMFWADNGKSGKVVPDLRTMFKHTKEGFELMKEFPEFYFSTGLYNYYIEAYPKAHPVYKPLLAFMMDGNMDLGLKQLNHAIHHTVYLRVEAILFMSLIQLHYENDLNSALIYAEKLHREFPSNPYYQGHLITILLHQHLYVRVREVLEQNNDAGGIYFIMIRKLAEAFMAEKKDGNLHRAKKGYLEVIALAEEIGPFAVSARAIGYMGLSRVFEKMGFPGESKKHAKKAANLTSYNFILDE